jgi:hypothetical protein
MYEQFEERFRYRQNLIIFTEFGTALTTILPILFQYCYKYCYNQQILEFIISFADICSKELFIPRFK